MVTVLMIGQLILFKYLTKRDKQYHLVLLLLLLPILIIHLMKKETDGNRPHRPDVNHDHHDRPKITTH